MSLSILLLLFFFNDTATTEIYTLSLHDALPILHRGPARRRGARAVHAARLDHRGRQGRGGGREGHDDHDRHRSEEHTSELQSLAYLVCRLLLEKKKI